MRPIFLVCAVLPLAACHDNISAAAADDAQVCYRMTPGARPKKTLVSASDDNLETCAMHLEGWRLIHRLPAVTGTFQGRYIYTSPQAITSSVGPDDMRYRLFTPGQHADLDQKLQILIARDAPQNTPQ